MRYSFTVAALFVSVVVANVPEYEYAEEVKVPSAEGGDHQVYTAYSTARVTVTDCDTTVKDCPLDSPTPLPVVETPLPSAPVAKPAVPTPAPEVSHSSVEVPQETHPSPPVVPSVHVPSHSIVPPVPSVHVPSHSIVPPVPSVHVPSYPTGPSLPSAPFPVGTAPAGNDCPVCPAPVTVYVTSTLPTTGLPVPSGTSPADEAVPSPDAPTDKGVPSPDVPTDKGVPSPDVPSDGTVPSPEAPIDQSVPSPDVPIYQAVPSGKAPIPYQAVPSGVAPAGPAASTGFVTGPQPTSPPFTPFTGSASTVGKSLALAGLAAFAAMFLA
jgi:hypothetical protein